MNRESCDRYLEDPEANASHLEECAECRAVDEALRAPSDDALRASSVLGPRSSVDVGNLPVAGWESASYRAWPLVLAGAIAVAVIATLLFAATGASPIEIMRGNVPSGDVLASMVRLASGAVQNAPVRWQVAIAICFVLVNGIFIMLLRRAPRGLDV
jgi:hypothetical protein